MKKAIVTVIGNDKMGIIASVTTELAKHGLNVLDITQTVLQDYFTMIMVVDISRVTTDFGQVKQALDSLGEKMEMSIRIQHEDIFNAMHKI